jgi:hypothetical protein
MIRPQVTELVRLGPFPSERDAVVAQVAIQQRLLESILAPVSDDEARELLKVFGPDGYYGLAWAVVHLVETAPGWPLADCLEDSDNEWIQHLRTRRRNYEALSISKAATNLRSSGNS